MEQPIEQESECRTLMEMLLYKMDRTLAVIGVVLLGAWGLKVGTDPSIQVTMAAIGGLVVYLGVKGK